MIDMDDWELIDAINELEDEIANGSPDPEGDRRALRRGLAEARRRGILPELTGE